MYAGQSLHAGMPFTGVFSTNLCEYQDTDIFIAAYPKSGMLSCKACGAYNRLFSAQLHIDGLVQERRNSSVSTMKLPLSRTNPSILGTQQ